MSKSWLKNPFRLEKRTLEWCAWGNVVTAAVLLTAVVWAAFEVAPGIAALGAHPPMSQARLDQVWNVVKLRKALLDDDIGFRVILHDGSRLINAVAFLGSIQAAFLLLNALYFYKAQRLLKAAEKSDVGPPN